MHPRDPTPHWLRRKRVPSVLPDGLVCGAAGGERASTQRGGGLSSGPWVCPRRSLGVVPLSGSCRPNRVGLVRIIWAQGHQLTHFPLSPVFAPSHLSLAKSGGGRVGGPEAGPEGKGMAEPTCSAGMELGRAQGHPDIPLLRPVWRRTEEKDKQARSKHHPDTNSGTLCLVEN